MGVSRSQEASTNWKLDSLEIRPIQIRRTEKSTCALVIKPSINLHISRKGRIKRLALWSNPFQDGTFQALGVVASGAGGTLSEL